MSNLPKGWEKKTLNDISELTSSKRIYLSDYVEKGVPFFRGKEISQLKKNEKVEDILYITEEKYEEIKQKFGIPVKNDILITAVGTLANTYRIPNNDKFYFKDGNLIWLKNISEYSIYLEYSLNFNKKLLLDSAIGSSQKALTIAELKKIKLAFPPIEEQKKIADILSTIDKKIAFVEENINATEELKKGLMQKLLTEGIGHTEFKNSELGRIPKSWEVDIIENLATVFTGSKDTQNKVDNGNYPFFVRSDTVERINTYSFEGEAVLTSGDGVGVGKNFHYVNCKFDYHQRVYNIHNFKSNILGKYFYEFFKANFYSRVSRLSAKNSVDSVRREMITKMNILVPPLEEQKQIAEILSTVDNKLENLKEKKQSFEELKKGLMQKLLTGEVRV